MEEDIIDVDLVIKDKIEKEDKDKLINYKKTINSIQHVISSNKNTNSSSQINDYLQQLNCEIETISDKIDKIENYEAINFYLVDSLEIVDTCKKIVNIPKKIDFIGKKKIVDFAIKKEEYTKYIFDSIFIKKIYNPVATKDSFKKKISTDVKKCTYCNAVNNFTVDNGEILICNICFVQKQMINIVSYTDGNRVNPQSKYIYDRQQHFKNCINQYQGKQCVNIPSKVYSDLENQFDIHGLLIGDMTTPREIRFSNITKTQINIFLKELKYSKFYEDVYLIYYTMTLIKPDDIGYIEDKLIQDFILISSFYDKLFKKTVNRKSFINTHYVFFQLLIKNKHKCDKEDFMILKTIDRKNFHDSICSKIFAEIGWNFTPLF